MQGPSKNTIGKYRWVITVLLLFSTTINYMDRQVISYLKEFFSTPVSKGGFGWTNTDFSIVTSCFTGFYATVTVFAGWIIDKIGTKLGLALSLIIWSFFGMLNALAGSTVALHVIIRSLFGIGEAGNFPASIKTVAEWFPKKERALATGIFNSGANIGAMIASLFVPWCMAYWGNSMGYKMAYLLTGASGLLWLIFWFAFYTTPSESKKLSVEEYNHIHSDDAVIPTESVEIVAAAPKTSWFKLLQYPQTWAFFTGKFLTDGIWWFLLFWLPDYLKKQFGLTGEEVMLPTFIVYGVAILGSTFGGSLPLFLINKGMPVYKARMTAMFIIALFPLVLLFTQYFGNKAHFGDHAIILAVALICIGAAAHQAWSCNIFTTVSDMFPKKAVGSVTGIGGMAGGLGGVLVQLLAGRLTDHYKDTPQIAYGIMFTICALAYIIAWAVIRILTARSKQIVL
ncbi:ACS family hexuronate transporter-like MFS transporter [Mucilaginibacter frigoritolerans]|jgi:MFS transporter, ACS family, hexuronate transporter|uniref:ACS family hexuronate transporter-like MFS transporter n=1 Tax=Mucilaginibacter frigoritolerans TaxID=652788 RepID=A0A562TQU4_9SPHI|nr:MFS transporter [Mucilaginibacter frigoritolerans]TWI95564.1 ACS family hexuronate transporter-like MFS transporter [Mucilaginibacter frigoritolerans]